ncbi:unnamed protein product [Dracunculus medinensis]|uniref:MARVEL domain-containing protein n=1 Tax=Dracunculus medinensis TaxID=318479 RepID=A0A0N4UDM3_DRAME|nr:unnamed protein product [Dracunculus medinensis]
MVLPRNTFKHLCFQRATMYVAISAIILCIFNGICMCLGVYTVNFALDVIILILNAVSSLMIFYALYCEKAIFLLPFIIIQVFQCAGFFMLAIYTLVFTLTYKRQTFNRKFDQILMVISIFIGIILAGWAVWVTTKCYHYLRREKITTVYNERKPSFWC